MHGFLQYKTSQVPLRNEDLPPPYETVIQNSAQYRRREQREAIALTAQIIPVPQTPNQNVGNQIPRLRAQLEMDEARENRWTLEEIKKNRRETFLVGLFAIALATLVVLAIWWFMK